MKKKIIFIIIFISLLSASILLLNVEVNTRQGINYTVSTKKVPLYFKALGFLYRHFAYKQLIKEIIKDDQTDKEKVLAIFEWTYENIREAPEKFPIVDDHILNIIIRGYGTYDQSADVFCMLCEYAGIPAAWVFISPEHTGSGSPPVIAVSLVELKEKQRLFDTYFGNYFLNKKREIASVDDLIANPDLLNQTKRKPIVQGVEYKRYFVGLKHISEKDLWKRGKYQMPFPRMLSYFKRIFKK